MVCSDHDVMQPFLVFIYCGALIVIIVEIYNLFSEDSTKSELESDFPLIIIFNFPFNFFNYFCDFSYSMYFLAALWFCLFFTHRKMQLYLNSPSNYKNVLGRLGCRIGRYKIVIDSCSIKISCHKFFNVFPLCAIRTWNAVIEVANFVVLSHVKIARLILSFSFKMTCDSVRPLPSLISYSVSR